MQSLVEIGCGTGRLAQRFIRDGFDYIGVDLNNEMIELARQNNDRGKFIEADMRNFKLSRKQDACIMTGRTSAYLITNSDVLKGLKAIHNNLTDDGVLCFDAIDANMFIPQLNEGRQITHEAEFEKRKFVRQSLWTPNPAQSWTFNWKSVYYEVDGNNELKELGSDNSTIRAFTKDDVRLMLKVSGFIAEEIENRASYAFDTFAVVARKTS